MTPTLDQFHHSQTLRERRSMKRTLTWWLLGLILLVSAAWSQDEKRGGGTEKEVAALEQQWLQSQKANNPDLIAPLLAEKLINTGDDGKVTGKTESLADAKATKYDSVTYDDVKNRIRRYGHRDRRLQG